jgi:hypothetical protein
MTGVPDAAPGVASCDRSPPHAMRRATEIHAAVRDSIEKLTPTESKKMPRRFRRGIFELRD